MKRLSGRMWASFILIGFVGQLAWTIENMYFNVFLYNTISTDPNAIATMVAASAAAATITTLLMGALSDRVGRRKPFICAGYILWGISTTAFGFIRVESVAAWAGAAKAASVAALLVVVMDCVMTFFGSTANDAAFNAYITDSTTPENRGKVESVLATLPLLSMLTIFGGFDWLTQQGEWRAFFLIFGALVVLTGILACFLLKETPQGAPKGNYFAEILYGFRPSVVRSNGALYLALLAFGVFSVAVQVFFPYLIIYMQNYLKLNAYALVLGAVLLAASLISILSGSLRQTQLRSSCGSRHACRAGADVLCAQRCLCNWRRHCDDGRLHACDGHAFRRHPRLYAIRAGRVISGRTDDFCRAAAHADRPVHRSCGHPQ